MWRGCTFPIVVLDCSVVNFLPFETVRDESLGGVLPFAIERQRRGLSLRELRV